MHTNRTCFDTPVRSPGQICICGEVINCRGVNPERVPEYWVKPGNRLRVPGFYALNTRARTLVSRVSGVSGYPILPGYPGKPVIWSGWYIKKKNYFFAYFFKLNAANDFNRTLVVV